ncbi:MAG: hypothetical protein V1875_08155 [Candidatus Altiarchaeota archaeon]
MSDKNSQDAGLGNLKYLKKILSPEYCVGIKVYEIKEKRKELAYYSKIVDELTGSVSKVTVKRAIDNLLDVGIIKADWAIEPSSNKWVRPFSIAGEATNMFASLYDYAKSKQY